MGRLSLLGTRSAGRSALVALAVLVVHTGPVRLAAQVQEAVFADGETPVATNRLGCVDPAGPAGFAASNAMKGTTP